MAIKLKAITSNSLALALGEPSWAGLFADLGGIVDAEVTRMVFTYHYAQAEAKFTTATMMALKNACKDGTQLPDAVLSEISPTVFGKMKQVIGETEPLPDVFKYDPDAAMQIEPASVGPVADDPEGWSLEDEVEAGFGDGTVQEVKKQGGGSGTWKASDQQADEEATAAKTASYMKVYKGKHWPKDQLESSGRVALKDAELLYQPVYGSSPDSRYFLIAAAEDLKVAARIKSNKVSIRFEGGSFKKYQDKLKELGLNNVSAEKQYASAHLNCESESLLRKTVGALLLGLGVQWQTPYPDIDVIKGHGA